MKSTFGLQVIATLLVSIPSFCSAEEASSQSASEGRLQWEDSTDDVSIRFKGIKNHLSEEHMRNGRFFTANGVESFLVEKGDPAGEAILMLHGVPSSSFLYRKVIPELANKGYRAMALDMPGLGFSSRPKNFDYSSTGMGEWLSAATEEIGLDSFHFVIHDVALMWGMEMVVAYPERIKSLTILNGPMHNLEKWLMTDIIRPHTWPFPIDRMYLSIFTPFTFLQGMHIQGILNKEEYGYEEADAWLEQLLYKDGGTAYLELMKGFEQTDEKEELYVNAIKNLNVPKQIVWPSSDPGFPVEQYGKPLQEQTGIDRFFIVNAKHFLQEDEYRVLAEYIHDMISEAPDER